MRSLNDNAAINATHKGRSLNQSKGSCYHTSTSAEAERDTKNSAGKTVDAGGKLIANVKSSMHP